MENKLFFDGLKNVIADCKKNNVYALGIFSDVFEKYGLVDCEEYNENIDYKKVYLRSYYDHLKKASFSLDFEGKETMEEEKLAAKIMDWELQKMDSSRELFNKYYFRGDMTNEEYQELLEKHDLL